MGSLGFYCKQLLSFAEAIVDKLEPRAEKKFPSTSTSSQLRLVDIATESKAAKATNSHPEREDKKEENSR